MRADHVVEADGLRARDEADGREEPGGLDVFARRERHEAHGQALSGRGAGAERGGPPAGDGLALQQAAGEPLPPGGHPEQPRAEGRG